MQHESHLPNNMRLNDQTRRQDNSTETETEKFDFNFLGLISYTDGLKYQVAITEGLRQQAVDTNHLKCHVPADADTPKEASSRVCGVILGLEHPPVITLGKRGRTQTDLLRPHTSLHESGIDVHHVSRGGHATLHSPGQLVIYPCVKLNAIGIGVRDFVCGLERCTQAFLAEHGIASETRPPEPGLYTKKGKIAFFGICVSRGISSHGISINICNDLSLFSNIRSCGKTGERFDSMNDCGVSSSLENLFAAWTSQFLRTFS